MAHALERVQALGAGAAAADRAAAWADLAAAAAADAGAFALPWGGATGACCTTAPLPQLQQQYERRFGAMSDRCTPCRCPCCDRRLCGGVGC